MQQQRVFVISAPSGGGKTSLVNALREQEPLLEHVVTHTTRLRRTGEIDGLHYHFVSPTDFQKLIDEDALIEWAEVYGQYYGTSKAAIQKVLDHQKYPVLNLDWQGAQSIRSLYSKQVTTIFILPPSLDELQKRMTQRGDSLESIQKRLIAAQDEIDHATEYDFIILNDCFKTAVKELKAVIDAHLS